jgi:hypothetical protein
MNVSAVCVYPKVADLLARCATRRTDEGVRRAADLATRQDASEGRRTARPGALRGERGRAWSSEPWRPLPVPTACGRGSPRWPRTGAG